MLTTPCSPTTLSPGRPPLGVMAGPAQAGAQLPSAIPAQPALQMPVPDLAIARLARVVALAAVPRAASTHGQTQKTSSLTRTGTLPAAALAPSDEPPGPSTLGTNRTPRPTPPRTRPNAPHESRPVAAPCPTATHQIRAIRGATSTSPPPRLSRPKPPTAHRKPAPSPLTPRHQLATPRLQPLTPRHQLAAPRLQPLTPRLQLAAPWLQPLTPRHQPPIGQRGHSSSTLRNRLAACQCSRP